MAPINVEKKMNRIL